MSHAHLGVSLSLARTSSILTSIAAVLAASFAGVALAESPCGCSGDFNGTGSVDAADLAILLGAWGTASGDVDLSGNGFVDAADLGILLGQWGVCGAPANDTCATAELLPSDWDQAVDFCTVHANTDGPANIGCDSSGSDQITGDVWYKVVSPITGTLDLQTCGNTFDTRLAVYEPGFLGATCPNGTIISALLLGCNDDAPGCPSSTLASHLHVPVEAGSTYTVRVGGYLGAEGTGTLDLHFHEPGDLIQDAIPVSLVDNGGGVSVVLTGNTLHMTPSIPANPNSCGGINDSKDVWFKLTVDCANGGANPVSLSASTCMPGTGFDTTLTLYKGDIGSLVELDCNDDQTWSTCLLNGVERKSYVGISPDNVTDVYWVRLAGFNGAIGTYEVKFEFHCLD